VTHPYLWELASQLAGTGGDSRWGTTAPPVQLERELNGGPNPMGAIYYADVVARHPDLPATAAILDLGCGYGRVARALTTRLAPSQHYTGLDPHAASVDWARTVIAAAFPNFSFARIDLASRPYNPTGAVKGTDYRFPFDDGSLDVVLMTSVLTHVDFATVEHYLRESARVLKPHGGRLITTMFLLDDDVDALLMSGRSTFSMGWQHGISRVEDPRDPELAIAHPRDAVLRVLDDVGLVHRAVFDGSWCGRVDSHPMDYQDLIIAGRTPRSTMRDDLTLPGPNEAQSTAIAAAEARLASVGVHGRDATVELVGRAALLALNALRWQRSGRTLAVARSWPRRPERLHLQLDMAERFGFGAWDPPSGDDRAGFVAVPEHELIERARSGGDALTADDSLRLVIETIDNGIRVLLAQRDGTSFVLADGERSARPVTIPPMSS